MYVCLMCIIVLLKSRKLPKQTNQDLLNEQVAQALQGQVQATPAAANNDGGAAATAVVHREVAVVRDGRGNQKLIVQETRGVVTGDGTVAVQREVHVVNLGDGRNSESDALLQREQSCSCGCCLKWTLLAILFLPLIPFLICYKCFCDSK